VVGSFHSVRLAPHSGQDDKEGARVFGRGKHGEEGVLPIWWAGTPAAPSTSWT